MTLVYNAVPQFSQWLSQFRVICTAFLITLVTLIVGYIHFAGLSPGKTTSGTIPRNQQDFLITNPASVIEYDPDFYIPMMGSPKLCSVAEGLNEIFRFKRIMAQLLYLYGHSKAACPAHPESQVMPGGLIN